VCLDCGRVEEFVDADIEDLQDAVAARLGFEIRHHALVMYGHCRKSDCAYRDKARNAS
jgi:Fur family ferric uptake transcriptional regulator